MPKKRAKFYKIEFFKCFTFFKNNNSIFSEVNLGRNEIILLTELINYDISLLHGTFSQSLGFNLLIFDHADMIITEFR